MDEERRYEYRECDGCTCCNADNCHRGPDGCAGNFCPCTEA